MPRRALILIALVMVAVPAAVAAPYSRPGRTTAFSHGYDGSPVDATVGISAVSGNGRSVLFFSEASNLVPGDTNGKRDLFVLNRPSGEIELLSVAADGSEANGDDGSPWASISHDGRYVVMTNISTNLVPGDENGWGDAFLLDRKSGELELISVSSSGEQGNLFAIAEGVSDDGRYVAFETQASNLVPGDTNETPDIFVRDRLTGVTERVSVASDGTQGNSTSRYAAISADGRFVAFQSLAWNLVPDGDDDNMWETFVHDRDTGRTELVSVATDGTPGNQTSSPPTISADGRYVAFVSLASNLVPQDTNSVSPSQPQSLGTDVFVRDVQTDRTERISVSSEGEEGNGESGGYAVAEISDDGRYVLFDSRATNLVPGDTNLSLDMFVHDRVSGETERVSVADDGTQANSTTFGASFGDEGRIVAFQTLASNMVEEFDNNGKVLGYVRDRGPAMGIGALAATPAGDGAEVSGWATFGGVSLADVGDPADAGDAAARLGAELLRASIVHRVEREDLLIRWELASLPGVRTPQYVMGPGIAGGPGIMYGLSFTLDGVAHEVRVMRASASGPAAASVGLFRCSTTCTKVADGRGEVGLTGERASAYLPLTAFGMASPRLESSSAFTAVGESILSPFEILDEAVVGSVSIEQPTVHLGVGSAERPDEVQFDVPADLTGGWFSGQVHATGAGEAVWARACASDRCGVPART